MKTSAEGFGKINNMSRAAAVLLVTFLNSQTLAQGTNSSLDNPKSMTEWVKHFELSSNPLIVIYADIMNSLRNKRFDLDLDKIKPSEIAMFGEIVKKTITERRDYWISKKNPQKENIQIDKAISIANDCLEILVKTNDLKVVINFVLHSIALLESNSANAQGRLNPLLK
jgi:hypothetical protein